MKGYFLLPVPDNNHFELFDMIQWIHNRIDTSNDTLIYEILHLIGNDWPDEYPFNLSYHLNDEWELKPDLENSKEGKEELLVYQEKLKQISEPYIAEIYSYLANGKITATAYSKLKFIGENIDIEWRDKEKWKSVESIGDKKLNNYIISPEDWRLESLTSAMELNYGTILFPSTSYSAVFFSKEDVMKLYPPKGKIINLSTNIRNGLPYIDINELEKGGALSSKKRGRKATYMWDDFVAVAAKYISDNNGYVPKPKSLLENYMLKWCSDEFGKEPTISMIREKLQSLYKYFPQEEKVDKKKSV